MAQDDIIAARRSRGLAYSEEWKASGFVADLIDNVQHGQYVVHVPTSNPGRVTPGVILKKTIARHSHRSVLHSITWFC